MQHYSSSQPGKADRDLPRASLTLAFVGGGRGVSPAAENPVFGSIG